MGRFPILMYHRIESTACPVDEPEERPWAVSLEQFSQQLDRLQAGGQVGVSMDQVHRELSGGRCLPPSWVAITFDDGNLSDHRHALPALAERGFRATFFVCGMRVGGAPGGLSAAMIREMHAAGMHVGSHAMSHRFLTTLPPADEEEELRRSRELLESIVGSPVDHFAPPGGRWSARTEAALRRLAYRAVATSVFGYNDSAHPSFEYRRMPVVRATGDRRFEAMVQGERARLFTSYARSRSLQLVRGLVGESAYRRVRAAGMGRRT